MFNAFPITTLFTGSGPDVGMVLGMADIHPWVRFVSDIYSTPVGLSSVLSIGVVMANIFAILRRSIKLR